MDKTFQKFLKLGIDLGSLGAGRSEDNSAYFCTPKGASIFGWAGVDGIHFCFIRGFGGMVFAVSPMNGAPDYVHPLSKDFADFLRLLLACGNTAALEQAWMWDEAQFASFLRENPPTPGQQLVLSEVAAKLHLTKMEHPWAYLKELQSSFDYRKIKYTEDYYDLDMNPDIQPAEPEWKVYFNGNFWGHHGKDRAGTEIPLGKEFTWANHSWIIPAAYSCSKGLVMDFCMRVEPEEIQNFIRKWNLNPENDSDENFTQEQQMQMEWENPCCLHFRPQLVCNGKTLRTSHGSGICFYPRMLEGWADQTEANWAVQHYGLDPAYCWVICRSAFPWAGKRRSQAKTLSLTMEEQPGQLPGPHFKTHQPGDTFTFSHPASNVEYTLTVQELAPQTLPSRSFGSDRWVYPTNMVAMSYTLSPEPEEDLLIRDCREGDRPIEAAPKDPMCPTANMRPTANSSAAVFAIGGADGPTSILFGNGKQGKLRNTYSSLHFESMEEDIEWRIDFKVRRFEEASFILL